MLEAHRARPIDGEVVQQVFVQMRSNPEELAELVRALITQCDIGHAEWLFSPVCGRISASRLDELADVARSHLASHEGCEAARVFLAHHALRRPADSPPPAWHLSLPGDFLAERVDRWGFREGHPTWVELADDHPQARLGGAGGTCSRCGGVAERLLLLPAASMAGIVATSRDVVFIWCAWCSPYVSQATFSKVQEGTATMLPLDLLIDPGPSQPIEVTPEMPVGLMRLGPDWDRQDWMWANSVENLYRVGGEPTWIQHPDTPSCPDCGDPLRFLAQLDIADITQGDGLAYLFWCDPSAISAVVYQQT